MQNDTQTRGCIPVVVYIFLVSWLCYGIFFAMGLWLTRALVWQHVLFFAGTLALITSITVRASLRQATPTSGMLVHRVKEADIERLFPDNPAWESLKLQLQTGDELWQWAAFGYTWMALGGRYGYIIVRDGKPTEHFMFVETGTSQT
jgi:hypothetical protein